MIVYVALMAMSRPQKAEGVFGGAHIDYYTPLSERIALALNGPATWFAWSVSALVDNQQWWFRWCVGVIPAFILWHLIGLWLDRFYLPALSNSIASWRNPTRLTATMVLCGVLVLVGLAWARLYASQESLSDWGFLGISWLVIWPTVICGIAIRTIRRGEY